MRKKGGLDSLDNTIYCCDDKEEDCYSSNSGLCDQNQNKFKFKCGDKVKIDGLFPQGPISVTQYACEYIPSSDNVVVNNTVVTTGSDPSIGSQLKNSTVQGTGHAVGSMAAHGAVGSLFSVFGGTQFKKKSRKSNKKSSKKSKKSKKSNKKSKKNRK